MTEVGRFFDAVLYNEADQAEVQTRFRREGVLYEVGNRLVVGAPGGMFVSVNTGEAMVNGFWYKNTASLNLAVGNNTSGSTRTDRVVLRLDRNNNTLSAALVVGTPGAGVPALTQNAVVWEMPLASIVIPTGTTAAITAGMITDVRTYSQMVQYGLEVADGVLGYSHLTNGAVSNLLLNYKAATDLFSASTITGSVQTDLVAAQNFTVNTGCTALLIALQISGQDAGTTVAGIGISILIDGTTRYGIAPAHKSAATSVAANGGAILIPGLTAGVHSVKPQIFSTATITANFYLRAATQPNIEWLSMQVLEFRR